MQNAVRGVTQKMMKVVPVRALEDNYMYLVYSEKDLKGFAVDPVEPQKIKAAAENHKVTVAAALVTHHHWDHAGGMGEFRKIWPADKAVVYGGDDRIDHLSHKVEPEEKFTVGEMEVRMGVSAGSTSCRIKCLQVVAFKTPCHTKGHVCYYVSHPGDDHRILLTGDTLFIAGCGKFFEGNGAEMHRNLNEILGKLPDDTRVYPGHEYTLSNLKFAHHIEPSNEHVKRKLDWAAKLQARNEPTVPSTIGEEKETNPFMRTWAPEIQQKVGATDLVQVMDRVRQAKNSFRG
ncbi:hypothetical protein Aduo_006468 [Ancylostoma duodenale]